MGLLFKFRLGAAAGAKPELVFWLLVACGSDHRAVPSGSDAAAIEVRDADAGDPAAVSDVMGQLDCDDAGNAEIGLQLLPEFVTAFRHVDAECESLPARFLLDNTQPAAVRIDGVRVSSRFSVGGIELPFELLPGRSVPLEVAYLGADLDSEEGTLTLSTSAGCVSFPVRGLATDGGLMTYSDLAMDFGPTRAGESSAPREFVIESQRAPSFPGSVFRGFSAGPAEVFEVIASPEGPQSPGSCEQIRFQVRFHAPRDLGRVEGVLGWSVTTETEDGIGEGTAFVPLYGTAVAD